MGIEINIPKNSVGDAVGGALTTGLNTNNVKDLITDIANNANIGKLQSLLNGGINLDQLKNFINGGINIDSLKGIINNGINLDLLKSIVNKDIGLDGLTNLINGGIDTSKLLGLLNSGVNLDQLKNLINSGINIDSLNGIINNGMNLDLIKSIVNRDIGLDRLTNLINGGIDTSKLLGLLNGGVNFSNLTNFINIDVNIDSLKGIINNGINLDQIKTVVNSGFNIDALKDIAKNGFNTSELQNIFNGVSINQLTTIVNSNINLDKLKNLVNSGIDLSLLKSIINSGFNLDGLKNIVNSGINFDGLKSVINGGINFNLILSIANSGINLNGLKNIVNSGINLDGLKNIVNSGFNLDGLKNIVNSGINFDGLKNIINSGVNFDLIRSIANSGINLDGLKNIVNSGFNINQLKNIVNSGFNTEQLKNLINSSNLNFGEIGSFIKDNMTSIMNGGVTNLIKDNLDKLSDFVNTLKSSVNVIETMQNLSLPKPSIFANQLPSFSFPSTKFSMLPTNFSIKSILVEKFKDIELVLNDIANLKLCINNADIMENVLGSINSALDTIEAYAKPLMQQLTNMNFAEVKFKAANAFQYVSMLKRVKKADRNADDESDEQNYNLDGLKNFANNAQDKLQKVSDNVLNTIKSNVDATKDAIVKSASDIKDTAKAGVEDITNTAVSMIKNTNWNIFDELEIPSIDASTMVGKALLGDLSKDEIIDKMVDWLHGQSIILANAFFFTLIMDMVLEVKTQCQHIGNRSIESLADFVNGMNDVIALFEMLGIKEDAVGLTTDDLKELSDILVDSLKNTAAYVYVLGMNAYYSGKELVNKEEKNLEESLQKTVFSAKLAADDILESAIDAYNKFNADIENSTDNVKANASITDAPGTVNYTSNQIQNVITDGVDHVKDIMVDTSAALYSIYNPIGDVNTSMSHIVEFLKNIKIDTMLQMKETSLVLEGKELMLDSVVQLYSMLKPVIKLSTKLAKLVENYNINKETVQRKSFESISEAFETVATKAMGLKDIISGKDVNFYTVRTEQVYNLCVNAFKINIDEASMAELTIPLTGAFIYCLKYIYLIMDPDDDTLSNIKKTKLYIDLPSIESGEYLDGTFDGLDNIMIDEYTKTIYYDKSNRPISPSQIMKALKSNINPSYINVEEDDDDDPFSSITMYTDEIEGQLVVSLADMNLCDPSEVYEPEETQRHDDPISDEIYRSPKPYAIIEFGTEYTKGEEVQINLAVKPGEDLYLNKVIGTIVRGGKTETIYSKFSKGRVLATSDESDYYHVFPNICDKHIIIADYEEGSNFSDTTEDDPIPPAIHDMMDKFKRSSEIGATILSFLPYSILPIILYNSNREETVGHSPNTLSTFTNDILDYEDYVSDLADRFEDIAENMKEEKSDGNPNNILKAKDDMLLIRKELIEYAWHMYDDALSGSVDGDTKYGDCINLAYGNNDDMLEFTFYSKKKKKKTKIYQNYYMSLYSMIDLSSDNQDVLELKRVIENIISRRMEVEDYDYSDLVYEFNDLYAGSISEDLTNPYKTLYDANKIANMSYDDVVEYLFRSFIDAHASNSDKRILLSHLSLNDEDAEKQWWEEQKGEFMNGSSLYQTVHRLANMFFYIHDANPDNIPTPKSNEDKPHLEKYKELVSTYISMFNEYVYEDSDDAIISTTIDIFSTIPYNSQNSDTSNLSLLFINKLDLKSLLVNGTNISESLPKEYFYDMAKAITLYQLTNVVSLSYEPINDVSTLIYIKQRRAFTLVLKEYQELVSYWNKVKDLYYSECDIENSIDEVKSYVEQMNSLGNWPMSQDINVAGKNYLLYEFCDTVIEKDEPSINDILLKASVNEIDTTSPDLDYESVAKIEEPEESTIRTDSYLYWLVYMTNATLFTLNPMYWADGFDIMPAMTPVNLPAIYFPVAPPIVIDLIHVTIVFGIALRGIWPAPIVLVLNLNSNSINATFPIMIGLEFVRKQFLAGQEYLENLVNEEVDKLSNAISSEIDKFKKEHDKFMLFASLIKSIPIPNKAAIEREFYDALFPDELINAKNEIAKTKKNILNNVENTVSNTTSGFLNEQVDNLNNIMATAGLKKEKNKRDKRQDVTRLDKLDEESQPM